MAKTAKSKINKNSKVKKAAVKPAAKPLKESKKTDFGLRCISGVAIIALTFSAIYFGGTVFMLFVAALGAGAVYEWVRMIAPDVPHRVLLGGAILSAVTLSAVAMIGQFMLQPLPFGVLAVLLSALFLRAFLGFRGFDEQAGLAAKGFFCIILSLSCLMLLNFYAGKEVVSTFDVLIFQPFDQALLKVMVAFLFVTVWASDSIAYVFGRLFGGPKLAPRISPNKTWSGFVGSCIGALAALTAGFYLIAHYFPEFQLPSLWPVVVVGLMFGALGQVGDLIESRFKRECNVKDSGNIIPGHGGVLDRIDALLLVTPFYYFAVMGIV